MFPWTFFLQLSYGLHFFASLLRLIMLSTLSCVSTCKKRKDSTWDSTCVFVHISMRISLFCPKKCLADIKWLGKNNTTILASTTFLETTDPFLPPPPPFFTYRTREDHVLAWWIEISGMYWQLRVIFNIFKSWRLIKNFH